MRSISRLGGYGALLAAATFVVGLTMYGTMLLDYTSADDPADAVAFLVDHQTALRIWNLVVTVVFALGMIPLTLAIHARLRATNSVWAPIATVFGLLWAGLLMATGMITNVGFTSVIDLHGSNPERAATVWSALDAVQRGLGGGNEIVGGVWVVLISIIPWRAHRFGRTATIVGLVAGACGLCTVVPAWESLGAVFGLGLIVWYPIVGTTLIRSDEPEAASATERPRTHWADPHPRPAMASER